MSVQEDHCPRAGDASRYVRGELPGRRGERFLRHIRGCEECAEELGLLERLSTGTPLLGTAHLPPEEDEDPGRRAPTPTLSLAAANARAARLAAEKAAAEGKRRPPMEPPTRPVLRRIEGGAATPNRAKLPLGGRRLLKTPMPRSAMVSFIALGVLAVATVAMTSQAASVHFFRIRASWPRGGAALKLVGNQLELLVEGMPSPPRGVGYQVWVANRATRRLAPTSAWVHLNRLSQAGVDVPGNYHDWAAIAVYMEPLTGRETPQRGAVVVGDLRGLQ
jgi:anti-sigma factor RsiW